MARLAALRRGAPHVWEILMSDPKRQPSRRSVLEGAALASALALTGAASGWNAVPVARADPPGKGDEGEGVVTAGEDLMREHGVLDRALLVYEAARGRLRSGTDLDPRVLHGAASLIHDFIENYHERLEEEHVFPRFGKAGREVELVGVLEKQHAAGRRLTDEILRLTSAAGGDHAEDLVKTIDCFVRMYRPHAAREDTVLFPALHRILEPEELRELGDEFEDLEKQRFGVDGFERAVGRVAELERALDIHDLSKLTPAG